MHLCQWAFFSVLWKVTHDPNKKDSYDLSNTSLFEVFVMVKAPVRPQYLSRKHLNHIDKGYKPPPHARRYQKSQLTDDLILNERFEWPRLNGIATFCDVIVCRQAIHVSKPFIRSGPLIVAVKMDRSYKALLRWRGHLFNKLFPAAPFVLLLFGSDQTIPRQLDRRAPPIPSKALHVIRAAFNHPKLVNAYVSNLDEIFHPKVHPIPVGLNNKSNVMPVRFTQYRPFDRSSDIVQRFQQAKKMTFINRLYSGVGQWEDRKQIYELCRTSLSHLADVYQSLPHKQFLKAIGSRAFTLCLHGGGIDPCPKAWEAILCGTIPIVQRHPSLFEAYAGLPLLVVDAFTVQQLSPSVLQAALDRLAIHFVDVNLRRLTLEKLSMRHWVMKLKSSRKRA